MSMDVLEGMKEEFRPEAQELLTELDAALLALEADPAKMDYVNRIFRAIHTLKGSGATVGFQCMAEVAHRVEEAFDLARSGKLPVTRQLIDCGLKATDIIRNMLAADDPEAPCQCSPSVVDEITAMLPHVQKAREQKPELGPERTYVVTLRPRPELFRLSADPMTVLDSLRLLGKAHVVTHCDGVPALADYNPDVCYLWWQAKLVSRHSAAHILAAFPSELCEARVSEVAEARDGAPAPMGGPGLLAALPAETVQLFYDECREHLDAVEHHALALEEDAEAQESVDALFRAVHSIKGNTGLLLGQLPPNLQGDCHGLRRLSQIAHAMETLLDAGRQQKAVEITLPALVLDVHDAMGQLLEAMARGVADPPVSPQLLDRLGLQQVIPSSVGAAPLNVAEAAFANTATQCMEGVEGCLRKMDSGEMGRRLLKSYERTLKTLRSAATQYGREDLEDSIARQLDVLSGALQDGASLNDENRAGLRQGYEATRERLQPKSPPLAPPAAVPPAPEPTAAKPAAAPSQNAAAAQAASTIRIDQEKLDRLMRVVGELLVAKGALPMVADKLASGEDPALVMRVLKDTGAGISRIAEELQASVMAIRMLPVRTVFQRFPRLVRDLARSLGKEVQLKLEGESIELDKTILERIGDPLVHLVRNAVDHGIGSQQDRIARGKPVTGTVTLRASNEAGKVCLEVQDDGRGLDAEALKRKAVQRGLITAEAAAAMSASDAYRLVFLPGLSTAEKVTEVSGRGVGMDVVLNNIVDLQGSVEIRSKVGEGTTFSIQLPTSLIVSKGILLEAGGQEYILPLTSIRDMVKVPAASVHHYNGQRITQVRGQVYCLFSLAEMFDLPVRESEEVSIAVVESGKVRYGLIADRFVSEVEVLVKPLTGGLEHSKEFHGAAILGDGRVVLVLNPLECHALQLT